MTSIGLRLEDHSLVSGCHVATIQASRTFVLVTALDPHIQFFDGDKIKRKTYTG